MERTRRLVVAGIQMRVCDGCPRENIGRVYEILSKTSVRGVDILVLPELWCCGYVEQYNDRLYMDALNAMKDLSKRTGALIVGSIPYPSGGRGVFYNRLYAVYRGRVEATYDKLHLFRPFNEDRVFRPGRSLAIVEYKGFRLGFAICYDLRFPDIFTTYRANLVDLVVVPSAWGKPRLSQWLSITAAEAAIAQLYVLAVNRVGESWLGEEFAGHSVLVDAWGDRVSMLGLEEGVLVGSVYKDKVAEARRRLPIFEDRRDSKTYGSVVFHRINEIKWGKV